MAAIKVKFNGKNFIDTLTNVTNYSQGFIDEVKRNRQKEILLKQHVENRKIFQLISENWNEYKKLLKFSEDHASTDVVYAMAAKIMGVEHVTLPLGLGPTIVHMKQHINGLKTENWPQELIWEHDPLRINTVAQHGMFHYHIKDWQ
jgi:hypothetical protein